jgi:hypothetical protein
MRGAREESMLRNLLPPSAGNLSNTRKAAGDRRLSKMLNTFPQFVVDCETGYRGAERRQHVRLGDAFPAKVQGIDSDGRPFDLDVEVENVSAGGYYVRMPRCLKVKAVVSATIRFSSSAPQGARPQWLSTHGVVERAEPQPDGTCGVAVEFRHHVFL